MAVVDGKTCDVTVPRCVCGREMGEIAEVVGQTISGYYRLPCPKCRDIVCEFGFDAILPRRRLLVVHTVNLYTGEVMPEEAIIVKDHVRGDRSRNRGGERLDPTILDKALGKMMPWRTRGD